jgi:hypothetical protein
MLVEATSAVRNLTPRGVWVETLAARAQNSQGGITARALKAWLLDQQLAFELPDGTLIPTLRGYVVGRGLR